MSTAVGRQSSPGADKTGSAATAPVLYRGTALRSAKRWWSATQRACSPDETLARIEPHLRRAGITRVADITGLDRIGVTVMSAVRPNATTLAAAAGKGFDALTATVSACMEGIELHHAENAALPVVQATYRSLARNQPVVDCEALPRWRESVWTPDTPLPFTSGFCLLRQEETALPLELACMPGPHIPGLRGGLDLFQVSSNGLASGNTLLEAICAGLYEVIERDAHAVVCAGERAGRFPPWVDLAGLDYPLVAELCERLESAGQQLMVRDLTSDVGVPVYQATIKDATERNVGIYGGMGAHLDPEIALVRALTEAVQGRAVYISGARDDMFIAEFRRWKRCDVPGANDALADPARVPQAPRRPDRSKESFEEDLREVLGALAKAGIESAVVVDLTRPEFEIPVVKVVVPGLEGYADFGSYSPGERARRAGGDRGESR